MSLRCVEKGVLAPNVQYVPACVETGVLFIMSPMCAETGVLAPHVQYVPACVEKGY